MSLADVKPGVSIDIDSQEERQTILHCSISQDTTNLLLRIWPTTYLRDAQSGKLSKIITAYNISFHPLWTPAVDNHIFTLIFEGLPKSCTSFDLIEKIPQSGGFYVPGISRNTSDVYRISV